MFARKRRAEARPTYWLRRAGFNPPGGGCSRESGGPRPALPIGFVGRVSTRRGVGVREKAAGRGPPYLLASQGGFQPAARSVQVGLATRSQTVYLPLRHLAHSGLMGFPSGPRNRMPAGEMISHSAAEPLVLLML